MQWSSLSDRLPDYHDLNASFLVAVGVVLAMLASLVTCLGLNLQKLSLCAPGNASLSPWRQPRWVLGFACVVCGSLIDFLAFGLAPQSLLAPLAALSLVWNLFMASYLLGETTTRADVKAAALIFVGTGFTVSFASHDEQSYSLDDLRALFAERRMAVYGIVVPLLLALHLALTHASVAAERLDEKRAQGTLTGFPAVLPQLSPQLASRLEMVGYAGFAGVVGGQSVLFAKSTVELLKSAFHGEDVFLHLETYVVIVLMAMCLVAQITFLNGGLKRFDSLLVVPVYQAYWIISGVAGGLVFFGEYQSFHGAQMLAFVLGTLVTLAGLLVLACKEHGAMPADLDGDDAEAEGEALAAYGRVRVLGGRFDGSDDEADMASTTSLTRADALGGDVELAQAPRRR